MTSNRKSLRVCLLQLEVQDELDRTLNHLEELVSKAVSQYQPHIIALPECFNFHYCTDTDILNAVAESISDGKTCRTLSQLSKQFGVFIVGGSIIERNNGNLYNTSTIWNANGELIASYRKVHLCNSLFDVGLSVVEKGKLTAGNELTTFHVNGFKCGIAICFDSCFDEFIKLYGHVGCDLLFFPSAYPVHIGLLHWELLLRARAVDNQLFVAGISAARNEQANYVIYGHSIIIDPNGNVLAKADTKENIVFHEIDLEVVQTIRREIPLFESRRTDILQKYSTLPKS